MFRSSLAVSLLVLTCGLALGCREKTEPNPTDELQLAQNEPRTDLIECPEHRPDFCTQIYLPVCGQIDSGIRCITTPCPSTVHRTFASACMACSDKNVTGYTEGECATDTQEQESDNSIESDSTIESDSSIESQ